VDFNYLDCSDPLPSGGFFTNKAYPLERMQIVFNMAIQSGVHEPNSSTIFPNDFEIDYIKYFKKADCCQQLEIELTQELGLLGDPEAFNFLCGSSIEIGDQVSISDDYSINIKASEDIILSPGVHIEEGARVHFYVNPNLCQNGLRVIDDSATTDLVSKHEKMIKSVNLDVIPNPVDDICSVIINPFSANYEFLELRDISGRLVISRQIENSYETRLNLGLLRSGIYVVSILDVYKNVIARTKIVKV
jgi:hypothetical protein